MTKTTLSTERDIHDFIEGCLALGTGGGGDPEEGLASLRGALTEGLEIGWVPLNEIDDDAMTVTGYAAGSIAPPDEATAELIQSLHLKDMTTFDDALRLAIEELGRHLGSSIDALVPVEIGASNTPGPLVAAARLGIVVPDGDYSGRAVPDEMQGTPFINDVRSDPFTSVDAWGNIAVVPHVANPYMLERISKMLSIAGIHGTSIASTPLAGRDMKRIIVPGTLSKALNLGRATHEARIQDEDPVDALVDAADGWRLFDGVVRTKDWEDRDGYMFGSITIDGSRPAGEGSELRLWFKNENHVSWLDGDPWVCSPDLLTIVDAATGRGFTSTDVKPGDRVSVVAMRGLPIFRTDDALRNAFGPEYFGFPDVPYVPVEDLV